MVIVPNSNRAVSLSTQKTTPSLAVVAKGLAAVSGEVLPGRHRASVYGSPRDLTSGLTYRQVVAVGLVGQGMKINPSQTSTVPVLLDVSKIKAGLSWS